VMIVGYYENVEQGRRMEIGFGEIFRKDGPMLLPKYDNLAVHDVPTAGTSSGSPVFAGSEIALIGIHNGFIRTQQVTNAAKFDRQRNFNLAFIFDERYGRELREMIELTKKTQLRIRGNGGSNKHVSLSSSPGSIAVLTAHDGLRPPRSFPGGRIFQRSRRSRSLKQRQSRHELG